MITSLLNAWTWMVLPLNFSIPSNLGNPLHRAIRSNSLAYSPFPSFTQTCHFVSSAFLLMHWTDVLSCTSRSKSKWAACDLIYSQAWAAVRCGGRSVVLVSKRFEIRRCYVTRWRIYLPFGTGKSVNAFCNRSERSFQKLGENSYPESTDVW